jgi:Predicted Fe-S oxidoreductase
VDRRVVYSIGAETPQVGTLAFGVVDRGTNVLEVRPTSICALSCIFCSVNAGPHAKLRWAEYVVEVDALLSALEEVVRFKRADDIEVHIDGMGDPGNSPTS